MLQRYLLIWLTALSWIAVIWPDIWGAEGVDPFTGSKPYLFWMVAATMCAVGMLLPPDEIREVARRWPVVAAGTTIQYTAMPLLAFSVTRLFGLSGEDLIGVVIVGCVPGAMASNVLTLNARGNTSYSVSLTTAATLLSPLVVPLILSLVLSAEVGIKPQTLLDTSYKLFMNVVLPVLLGQLIMRGLSWWSEKAAGWAKVFADAIAHLAILWIIAVVVGLNRQHLAQIAHSK